MIGTSLNQYQITASIGAGGMGEVFRARDTRLNRDVAVKVLPKDFAADANRQRRFEQEAKTLAALNHPNILTIHDAGVHEGAPYLVSELLRGQTLREVLGSTATTALPVRKATEYALQIAQGLAAAHGKGVVHRDLKPENIFVTQDGRVKILDFGLAKLKVPSPDLRPPSPLGGERVGVRGEAATIRIDADAILNTTQPGMVLGTPAYMSPEQVRGELADHRADIFAFGAVLYEMLSGTRAFRRDTPVESMNAILNEDPPELIASNANISHALEHVVRRCLEKQPDNRFQSAKDLAFAIENAATGSASRRHSHAGASRSRLGLLASTAIALFVTTFLIWLLWTRHNSIPVPLPTTAPLRKFELYLSSPLKRIGNGDELHPAVSPDGKKLVYANADGLWLRWLDRMGPAVRLAAGENIVTPFWSPDSMDVGYFEGRKVLRVSINEGRPRLLCTAPDDAGSGAAGGAWLTKDRIVFGTGWCCLYEVSAQGGKFTEVDRTTEEETDFHNPSALPGGRGVLLTVHRTAGIDTIAVWTSLKTRKVLLQLPGSMCFYPVFSPSGHVLFQRSDAAGGIWAFAFSIDKLERTGEPFRVSDFGTLPSVSEDGTLVFCLFTLDEFAPRQLAWMDRTGKLLSAFGPVLAGAGQQRISPDGRRVVIAAGETASALNIWSVDVASGGAIPVARNQEMEASPFWWRDGRMVVFSRQEGSTSRVIAKPADGTGEEILLFETLQAQTGSANFSMHLSSSGKYFFAARTSPTGKITLGHFALDDPNRKFIALPAGYQETSAWCLSPDDQLLAYQSRESGQFEVYAVEFPGFTSQRTPVSRGGGRHPVWHPAANQLYYLSNDGQTLLSARLKPDGRNFEAPAKVFDLPEEIHGGFVWWPSFYDVAPDGERFLMLQKVEDKARTNRIARPNVLVVQNWFEEFRDKK